MGFSLQGRQWHCHNDLHQFSNFQPNILDHNWLHIETLLSSRRSASEWQDWSRMSHLCRRYPRETRDLNHAIDSRPLEVKANSMRAEKNRRHKEPFLFAIETPCIQLFKRYNLQVNQLLDLNMWPHVDSWPYINLFVQNGARYEMKMNPSEWKDHGNLKYVIENQYTGVVRETVVENTRLKYGSSIIVQMRRGQSQTRIFIQKLTHRRCDSQK